MTFGPRSVDAYGRESSQDRCESQTEVGWGAVHGYAPTSGNVLWKQTEGKVALGWNIARRWIVKPKKRGYATDRRSQTVGPPEGTGVWVVEGVKAHADV